MADTKTGKSAKTPFKVKVAKFFREYKSEIKKISWSKPDQTFNNTWVVVVCSVLCAVLIGLSDFLFSKGILFLGSII